MQPARSTLLALTAVPVNFYSSATSASSWSVREQFQLEAM